MNKLLISLMFVGVVACGTKEPAPLTAEQKNQILNIQLKIDATEKEAGPIIARRNQLIQQQVDLFNKWKPKGYTVDGELNWVKEGTNNGPVGKSAVLPEKDKKIQVEVDKHAKELRNDSTKR